MERIDTLELRDESVFPDEPILREVLGEAYEFYQALTVLFEENGWTREWRYYRDGKAWLCKVQKKKKTIAWMSAHRGFMQAVIYIPERLTEDALELPFCDKQKESIRTAQPVGKSRPLIFHITDRTAFNDFETATRFKIDRA